ncbi:MAG TPA: hypothetical protein PLS03_17455, partial [Terrimicrobiaceae bacterium]|nr:hypothetical protein [Terrimicrobiaceae bacterium]
MQASSVALLRRFVAGLATLVTSLGLAPAALASAGHLLAPTTDSQEAPEIRLPSEHSAFPLTGKATIHGVLAARGPLPKGLLEFRLGDVKFSEKETPALRKNRTLPFLVPFEAGAFSEGEHVLTVVWKGASQQVQAQKTIRLGRLPSPDAMPVWLWMYGGPQNAEFYKWAGFTSVGGPPVPQKPDVSLESQLDDVRTVAEQSVLQGLMLSSSPANSLLPRDFAALPSLPLASARYKGTSAESKDYLDPFDPEVQRAQDTINDKFIAALAPFPNWKYAFVDMEYQDYLTKPSLSAHAAAYLTKEKGLPPEVLKQLKPGLDYAPEETGAPSWVAKGVIADHDIKLRLVRATHSGGNGVNRALQGIKEALRRNKRPDVQIITCPYRSNPVKRMYSGADIISSWTYTNPDPKYMLFTETLRAACGEGQTPMHTITLLNYPGTLMPSEKGWTMISPDIAKLSSWIDLSRVPKILSFFYSSAIDPVKFAADTERVPPETSAALAEMADKVYRPLGGLIRQLQLFPRKAALLNSQTARLYPASLALIGYPGYDILPFQCVLEMAHIPADVLLDEDVETGALD